MEDREERGTRKLEKGENFYPIITLSMLVEIQI